MSDQSKQPTAEDILTALLSADSLGSLVSACRFLFGFAALLLQEFGFGNRKNSFSAWRNRSHASGPSIIARGSGFVIRDGIAIHHGYSRHR